MPKSYRFNDRLREPRAGPPRRRSGPEPEWHTVFTGSDKEMAEHQADRARRDGFSARVIRTLTGKYRTQVDASRRGRSGQVPD